MASYVSGAVKLFIEPQKRGNMSCDSAQYATVLAHMEHVPCDNIN